MNYCESFCRTIQRMCNSGGELYTPVQYIESSGAQFLDTGLVATPYTATTVCVQCSTIPAQTRIFSTEQVQTGIRYAAYISGSIYWSHVYSASNYVNSSKKADTYKHTVTLDGYNQRFMTDGIVRNGFTRPSESTQGTIKLLSTGSYGYMTGRLYGCYISDNNIPARDYIPCYRNSDRKPGLYDRITGEFLTNQGTGEFSIGSAIADLPNDYQQVDYLQGNGGASENGGNGYAHIDTGVTHFADFEIDVQSANSSLNCIFCGTGYNVSCLKRYDNTSPYYYFINSGSGYSNYMSNVDVSQRSIIRWKDNKVYINNEYVQDIVKDTASGNFTLFGAGGIYYKNVRIYSCKLWDTNGQLIRNFIPCVRWQDETFGMYDTVNSSFYTSAGSTFIRGGYV